MELSNKPTRTYIWIFPCTCYGLELFFLKDSIWKKSKMRRMISLFQTDSFLSWFDKILITSFYSHDFIYSLQKYRAWKVFVFYCIDLKQWFNNQIPVGRNLNCIKRKEMQKRWHRTSEKYNKALDHLWLCFFGSFFNMDEQEEQTGKRRSGSHNRKLWKHKLYSEWEL